MLMLQKRGGRAGLMLASALVVVSAITLWPRWLSGAEAQPDSKRDMAETNRKLKDIQDAQQQILDKLDAIMKEVQIVKVRSTR